MTRVLLCLLAMLWCESAVFAAAAGEDARFSISEFRVLGNSVMDTRDVERAVYPFLGDDKSLRDVENARLALQAAYQDKGYGTVFVDIPEQAVDAGIVRLRVTEGKLAHTRVTGARYFSGRDIRAELPSATENTIPHLPTLQSQLAALNTQTLDRSVTPVLKAGASPGAIDLSLKVQDELPLHGSVELNDQYATDTSRLRAIAAINYDNLFGRLDSLALQYQTSPQDTKDAKVWAASYTTRLSEGGTKLAFSFVNSDSDIATVGGGAGGSINIVGAGRIYGSRLVVPLAAAPEATHLFIAGLEYKDFVESIFSDDLVLTPISYANLSLGHTSAWRLPTRQWTLNSNMAFGLRGRLNDSTEFDIKRFKGKPNYFLLRSDGSFTTALPWRLSLRLRASGQYALESIISNEQFSIAGADGVRGYREGELLGDVGIKTSLELASPQASWFAQRVQGDAFLFFDYGRMTRLNPLREQDQNTHELLGLLERPNQTLRSIGAGVDFSALEHLHGQLVWALPLLDTDALGGTQRGDSRLHFSVVSSW